MRDFDRIIIGAGLSGATLLDRWLDEDPERRLRVAVVDPHPDALRERTFATWRPKGPHPHRYDALVSHRWDRFRILAQGESLDAPGRDFGDFVYELIPGEHLHAHLAARRASHPGITWVAARARTVQEFATGGIEVRLETGECLRAPRVFSSATRDTPSLVQHFLGFEVETTRDTFDPEVADLMDFDVAQRDETRFVYTLPFARRRALVEFTVFSNRPMPEPEQERALRAHLETRRGLKPDEYRIARRERGVIPMSLDLEPRFAGRSARSAITPIGAAAGRVKASTGYSFLRNERDLDAQLPRPRLATLRFEFYDSLLLRIMAHEGARVSRIFPRLFARNRPAELFRFLEEQSRPREEARIFARLPWTPFLASWVAGHPWFWCAAVALALPSAGWGLAIGGLLTVGMAHGAADHLWDPGYARARGRFFAGYLGRIAAAGALWWVSPLGALAAFLAVSAWHFGECEFARALRVSRDARAMRAGAWAWGAFVTGFAPLLHWGETRLILERMGAGLALSPGAARLAALGLLIAGITAAAVLDRYERAALRRPRAHAAATLALAGVFASLPLMLGFTLYFAWWHAWDSSRQQRRRLGDSPAAYVRATLPFTAAAWLGTATLGWALLRTGAAGRAEPTLWAALLIAISGLTAAHAGVMRKFYRETDGADPA